MANSDSHRVSALDGGFFDVLNAPPEFVQAYCLSPLSRDDWNGARKWLKENGFTLVRGGGFFVWDKT